MCDFIPSSCFRKVIGRMRRVSAISDYLKSKREGRDREEGCEGGEWGARGRCD